MEHEEILKAAIEKWGVPHQLNKLKEELAELIVAVSHWEQRRIAIGDVVVELVDVTIMLGQLGAILSKDTQAGTKEYIDNLFTMEMEEKFKRLEDKIKQ